MKFIAIASTLAALIFYSMWATCYTSVESWMQECFDKKCEFSYTVFWNYSGFPAKADVRGVIYEITPRDNSVYYVELKTDMGTMGLPSEFYVVNDRQLIYFNTFRQSNLEQVIITRMETGEKEVIDIDKFYFGHAKP